MSATLGFVGHEGQNLTPSDEAALACALKLLGNSYRADMQFWGKVLGMDADYLVVQAEARDDALRAPITLFSTDCGQQWHLLPSVDSTAITLCSLIRGAFEGDPAYGYIVKGTPVREALRLAAFVQSCSESCAVIPRGAYVRNELGNVVQSKAFHGLDEEHAGKLTSYFHKRPLPATSAMEKQHLNPTVDCMPSIQSDIPKGVWRVALDDITGTVFGSSLRFPGAVFYHKPHTQSYGYYYVGDGLENSDLAFML